MERRMRSALLVPMFAVGMLLAGDLTTTWAGTPYADAVLADSPVAYWGFNDDATNTTTPDLTANGRTLYYMSNGAAMPPPNDAQTTAPGQPGLLYYQGNKACFFNGNLDAGNGDTPDGGAIWSFDAPPPNPSCASPAENPLAFYDYITIESWIKDTSTATPGVVNGDGRRIETTRYLKLGTRVPAVDTPSPAGGNRIWFTTAGRKDYFSPANSVPTNEWVHVAVVWENDYNGSGDSRAQFYVNGSLVGADYGLVADNKNGTYSAKSERNVISVGRNEGVITKQQWLGYIDELAVYHAKLTAEQILAHYNASPFPPPPAVSLGLTGSPMTEAGGQATITASLSWAYTNDVTVNLAFSGTATLTSDFTRTATNIVIPAGSTSGSVTLTAVLDVITEIPDETVVVDIASVVNGTNGSPSQVTATIVDIASLIIPAVTLSVTGSPMP